MTVLIVDGGGTKTRGWLIKRSENGSAAPEDVVTVDVGPTSFGAVGAEGVAAALRDLKSRLPGTTAPVSVVLGLAGVGRKPERDAALGAATQVFAGSEVSVITDAELAYRGAFADGRHGILLITGTGTIALYRAPISHEFTRAGGWGPLLGDEGSGAWLGREALRHCLLEWERDELSPLHAAVLEALEIELASQILTKVYKEGLGPSGWAKLAPLVFRYVREDLGAFKIMNRAAIELVSLAGRLQETLLPEAQNVPLVVIGGLWEHRYHLQPLMEEEIRLRNLPFVFAEPSGGPMEGGLLFLQEWGRTHTESRGI
ncbi:MAG TPA: BadF/BadG/BcrA/BcrD ATPase family protein [bacterium]|jgi:glucosamine kinase